MGLEVATWVASWCAAIAALILFPALGFTALARLRRARAARVEHERARGLGAIAAVAFVGAVGLQLSFVPFYARSVAGYVVRGEITRVTRAARAYTFYTADIRYENRAGEAFDLRAGASREQYEACESSAPTCALPTNVIVVDAPLDFDQAGSKPTVPGFMVAIAYVIAGLVFVGLRRFSPSSAPNELEGLLARARQRLQHVLLFLSSFVVLLITAEAVPHAASRSTLLDLAKWSAEGVLILGVGAVWARWRAKAIARLSVVMARESDRIRSVEIKHPVSPLISSVEVTLDSGERLVVGYWTSQSARRLVEAIHAARSAAT